METALDMAAAVLMFAQDTTTFSLAVLSRGFETVPLLLRHSSFSYAQQAKPHRPIVWEYLALVSKLGSHDGLHFLRARGGKAEFQKIKKSPTHRNRAQKLPGKLGRAEAETTYCSNRRAGVEAANNTD